MKFPEISHVICVLCKCRIKNEECRIVVDLLCKSSMIVNFAKAKLSLILHSAFCILHLRTTGEICLWHFANIHIYIISKNVVFSIVI